MAWISRKLYNKLDDDRIFEEMDKMRLEAQLIDIEKPGTSNTGIIASSVVLLSGSGYLIYEYGKPACISLGALLMGAYITKRVLWKKVDAPKTFIRQIVKCRDAIKKRQHISFSISMQYPDFRHDPIHSQCCHILVEAIRILANESEMIHKKNHKNESSLPLWKDLYTDEICVILESYDDKNKEEPPNFDSILDVDSVLETLFSIFRLHLSEYLRLLIVDCVICKNIGEVMKTMKQFLKVCGIVEGLSRRLKDLEMLMLRGIIKSNRRDNRKIPKHTKHVEMDWRSQVSVALDCIQNSLESENVKKLEIDLALRKTLMMLVEENRKIDDDRNSKIETMEGNDHSEIVDFDPKNRERTDIDMVFEGATLSDQEKKLCEVGRDLLNLGSENRKHHQSLLGELQMALEPRRSDFEKRERSALARWYGVDEKELKVDQEEELEGVGTGEENAIEIGEYDWRLEAEHTEGVHQTVNDMDFLELLETRKVRENVIE